MIDEESDFSSLKTVSSFDKGGENTLAVDLDNEDLQRFSPSSLLVESLIEQLCKLLEKDPKKWRTLYLSVCEKLHHLRLIDASYEREEFEFMRSYYQKALYQLVTIAKSTSIDKALISPPVNDSLKVSSEDVIQWSRYSNEFEELEYIAKGGFGQVYKAQHKLDGGVYAVKKIYLRYHNVNDFLQYLREVKMLAKLNHPNIVSYKAAWLEPITRKRKIMQAIEISEETLEEDSLEVVFESSHKKTESEVITSERAVIHSSSTERQMCKYEMDYEEIPNIPDWAVLYIQMQLCQQTLRQWLDVRNSDSIEINIDKCIDIFTKVVKGVEYIHSRGIVHHDIKPSNIFISEDLNEVQVGDFGLACNLLSHQSPLGPVLATHPPGQIGTKLYAAPEQLRGHCHPKSDVYSLGIVLFELVMPFNTAMERSKVIGQLKSGHIPSTLLSSQPQISKIISDTVCISVKKRPSSSELLAVLDESVHINTQRLLTQQNETIMLLRKQSLEKDEEIAALREQIQRLKTQQISQIE